MIHSMHWYGTMKLACLGTWYADCSSGRSVSLRGKHQGERLRASPRSYLVGNEDVCRIELNGGAYMEQPPPGNYRDIMQAYARHAVEIGET